MGVRRAFKLAIARLLGLRPAGPRWMQRPPSGCTGWPANPGGRAPLLATRCFSAGDCPRSHPGGGRLFRKFPSSGLSRERNGVAHADRDAVVAGWKDPLVLRSRRSQNVGNPKAGRTGMPGPVSSKTSRGQKASCAVPLAANPRLSSRRSAVDEHHDPVVAFADSCLAAGQRRAPNTRARWLV